MVLKMYCIQIEIIAVHKSWMNDIVLFILTCQHQNFRIFLQFLVLKFRLLSSISHLNVATVFLRKIFWYTQVLLERISIGKNTTESGTVFYKHWMHTTESNRSWIEERRRHVLYIDPSWCLGEMDMVDPFRWDNDPVERSEEGNYNVQSLDHLFIWCGCQEDRGQSSSGSQKLVNGVSVLHGKHKA